MSTATSGLSRNNLIFGTTGANKLTGGASNDTIDGRGGGDNISAGAGDDTIVFYENDIKINGGAGFDTLLFSGKNQKLNLGGSVVSGIEQLTLGGGGGHQVWLTAADIVRVSDTDQMLISGSKGNLVNFADTGWRFSGLSVDGKSGVYTNGLAKAVISNLVFINGFSENAVIKLANTSSTSVTEDTFPVPTPSNSMLMAKGTITIQDQNQGQDFLSSTPITSVGTLGSLMLGTAYYKDGVRSYDYTYSVDNSNLKVQELGIGKFITDTFTVNAYDGKTFDLVININGTNDKATISKPPVAVLAEDEGVVDGYLVSSGTVSISDRDLGQSKFALPISIGPVLGELVIDPNGSSNSNGDYTYTYTYKILNSIVQYLKEGELLTESFKLTSIDGSASETLSFTINGKEDFKFDTSLANITIEEYGDGSAEETNNQIHFDSETIKATGVKNLWWTEGAANTPYLGNFNAFKDASGDVKWIYTVEDKYVDYLRAGEIVTQKYTINVMDEAGNILSKTVLINLSGTSDLSQERTHTTGTQSGFLYSEDDIIVRGQNQDDVLNAQANNVKLYGEGGSDYLVTSGKNSILRGGDGIDVLYVSSLASDNEYYGDFGNDFFTVFLTDNDLWGGPGRDRYTFFAGEGMPTIHDFDTRTPVSGNFDSGDLIEFSTSLFTQSQIQSLDLIKGDQENSYFLTIAGKPILEIIGNDLKLSDFYDNVIGYTPPL